MIRTEASEKEKRIKNIVIRGLQENLPANDTETVNTLLSDGSGYRYMYNWAKRLKWTFYWL